MQKPNVPDCHPDYSRHHEHRHQRQYDDFLSIRLIISDHCAKLFSYHFSLVTVIGKWNVIFQIFEMAKLWRVL